MEHRYSTCDRHLTLFCAVSFASSHRSLSNSDILSRLQVCRGLPLTPRMLGTNIVFTFHCPIFTHAFRDSNFIGSLSFSCLTRWSNRALTSCISASPQNGAVGTLVSLSVISRNYGRGLLAHRPDPQPGGPVDHSSSGMETNMAPTTLYNIRSRISLSLNKNGPFVSIGLAVQSK